MPIFVSFSLFKIIAIAFICLFFNASGLIFLVGTIAMLFMMNGIICFHSKSILSWFLDEKENLNMDGKENLNMDGKETVDTHY